MKQLKDINIKPLSEHLLITEAWGVRDNYNRKLNDLLDKFKKRTDSYNKRQEKAREKGKSLYTSDTSYKVFRGYPISILVDKMNYKPEMRRATGRGRNNGTPIPDTRESARFIAKSLENGDVTPEQLAQWWKEYDEKVNKEQYLNPDWIIKHIDPTMLFDPYDPDNTYQIDKIIENPAEIVSALRYSGFVNKKTGHSMLYYLSQDEREEVATFYTEPQNQEMLHKLFVKAKNRFMKVRPTIDSAVHRYLSELFTDGSVDYDGCDLQRALEKEREERNRSYYQGSNYRSEEAHAVISTVMRALNDYYGLDISNGVAKNKDEAAQRKFLKDAQMGLHVDVHKGDMSKTDHSGVHSSSFWTYYKYDIDVKIRVYNGGSGKNKYDEVFEKTYEGVTLGSDYFSGGWN